MLKSYKFESRHIDLQVIEQDPKKAPFEIGQPGGGAIEAGRETQFAAKIQRETRATRSMMWLWTAEATADGQGYRVIGTGAQGTLRWPPDIAVSYPAVIDLRLYGMNANGKVYSLDKTYQLNK
jgi:hypothetical protein